MAKFLGTTLMCNRLLRMLLPLFLVTTIRTHSFALSPPIGPEEPSNLTYHSTASEVRLVFFATDEHNHSLEALQRDDFAVVDDERVIRDFRSFTRSASINLDVIVLMDSSESVLPQFEHEVTDVQQLISQWPWNPADKVSVLSFSGTETHFICSGNCGSVFIPDRVASSPRGGPTPLFDALGTATSLLSQRRQPDVWPVIVLFSDGDDTISISSFDQALEKVLATGAQIYTIDVGSPGQPSNGTATLQRIADDSGGRYVRIGAGSVGIFRDVIDDLHSARVVTYALPNSGSDFHSIRILPTHNLNFQFRCRRGYYHHLGGAH
jgi:Mg-chelatase subunit ChlD